MRVKIVQCHLYLCYPRSILISLHGDLSEKPGWVRISLHPTMTDEELSYILNTIEEIILNINKWSKDYTYSSKTNEYNHISYSGKEYEVIKDWFELD